jgi:hypothetical protein
MEDLHTSIEAFLRARRARRAARSPSAADPQDLTPRLTRLAAAYGQGWPTAIHQLPAFVQLVAAEAGEDRLAGMDEYPGIVRAEMRHSGPPRGDQPHASAPSEAQQAIRILRDARLWPWQRALWHTDEAGH